MLSISLATGGKYKKFTSCNTDLILTWNYELGLLSLKGNTEANLEDLLINVCTKTEVSSKASDDCSTLTDLEGFIDKSYQSLLPQSDNDNISSAQFIGSSTPFKMHTTDSLMSMQDQFKIFKEKIESTVTLTREVNTRSLKAFVPSTTDCTSKQCKITLLQHLVYSATYDIVCICETWLNASVLSNELLPGYSIFRRDRVRKIGGGVLVAVKNNLHATRRFDLEKEDTELVVVELAFHNCKSTLLYTFYRPHDSCGDAIQHLNSSLQHAPESSCVILIGDFNLPAINWSLDFPTPTVNGGHLEESFCNLVGDNFLKQFIAGPTHVRGNKLICCFVTALYTSRM